MKNHRHIGIYLALLGGGLLTFVYQNNLKPSTLTTATATAKATATATTTATTTATAAVPVNPVSLEDLANFQSAVTGNQFSGEKFRTFKDFAFRDGIKSKILSSISFSHPNRELDFLNQTKCDKWGVMTTIR